MVKMSAPDSVQQHATTEEQARKAFCEADAVCIDVDSTLTRDEGLDEFAKFCGVGEEVAEW